MRAFPAVDCDEISSRALIGWLGILVFCLGIPSFSALLIVLYIRRSFSSSLAYVLTRSIFAGHNDSAPGFGFRVFGFARVFGLIVVATDPGWLGELSQAIGFGGLFSLTLLLEAVAQPRTTPLMNILESVKEMVVVTVLAMGFLSTGSWITRFDTALDRLARRACTLQSQCGRMQRVRCSSTRSASTLSLARTSDPCCLSVPFISSVCSERGSIVSRPILKSDGGLSIACFIHETYGVSLASRATQPRQPLVPHSDVPHRVRPYALEDGAKPRPSGAQRLRKMSETIFTPVDLRK
jgi:hypothetical protein